MTEVQGTQVNISQSERLAGAILKAVRDVFDKPEISCGTTYDGASTVVFHGFFGQVHLVLKPSGHVLVSNFPEPCRTIDLTEIASSSDKANRYSSEWWIYLARGLREVLTPENMLEMYRSKKA